MKFLPLLAFIATLFLGGCANAQPPAPPPVANETARASFVSSRPLPNSIWLDSLDLSLASGRVKSGAPLNAPAFQVGDTTFARGVGVRPDSRIVVNLKGVATRFLALAAVDESAPGKGGYFFRVAVDGETRFDSGLVKGGDAPQWVDVPLGGAKQMVLTVNFAPKENWLLDTNWIGAAIVLAPDAKTRPQTVAANPDEPEKLSFEFPTPDAQPVRIFAPRVVGTSPGKPFLWRIPATGKNLTFSAQDLPPGLKLDAQAGIVSGQIARAGVYDCMVSAAGDGGKDSAPLAILCGPNLLARTPWRGWNAWNVFGDSVSADKVEQQADYLIASGLAARGFDTVMVDDSWQDRRDKNGVLEANQRFGDIRSLADYLHARGLKLGLYSVPGASSCGGYNGSLGFEAKDAAQFAAWGVDFLKYDWCDPRSDENSGGQAELEPAFAKMGAALRQSPRDIVYALTPYGFGEPWKWAAETGANGWWTSAQAQDRWDLLRNNAQLLGSLDEYAAPGRWNDGGWLSMGRSGTEPRDFSRLSFSEQQTQLSLWAIAASPLVLSADLSQLDPNALAPVVSSLLFHEEILAIQNDALGAAGGRIEGKGDGEVWARPLVDGTWAVALWNKDDAPADIEFPAKKLRLSGSFPVRDVWTRTDLGAREGDFSLPIAGHGVRVLKVGAPLSPSNQLKTYNASASLLPIWSGESGLRYLWSRDGQQWRPTPDGKVVFKGADKGGKRFRDPSLLERNGVLHLVWTSGQGAGDRGFGYARSDDGVTWDAQFVPLKESDFKGNLEWARAPKLLFDAATKKFVVLFAAQTSGAPKISRIYSVSTSDFQTWSAPQLLLDAPSGADAPTAFFNAGKWTLIYRDVRTKNLRSATAPTLSGPFAANETVVAEGADTTNPAVWRDGAQWILTFGGSGKNPAQTLISSDGTNWKSAPDRFDAAPGNSLGAPVSVSELQLQNVLRGAVKSR